MANLATDILVLGVVGGDRNVGQRGVTIRALSSTGHLPTIAVELVVAVQVVTVAIDTVHPRLEMNVCLDTFPLTQILGARAATVTDRTGLCHGWSAEKLVTFDQPSTHGARQRQMTVGTTCMAAGAIRLPDRVERVEIFLAAA